MCICICICICICVYVCIQIYVCTYIYVCIYIYTRMYRAASRFWSKPLHMASGFRHHLQYFRSTLLGVCGIIWEFPKIKGPNIDPRSRVLMLRTPTKRTNPLKTTQITGTTFSLRPRRKLAQPKTRTLKPPRRGEAFSGLTSGAQTARSRSRHPSKYVNK